MSAHLQSRVWFLDLGRRDQVLLQALADHAHDDGSHVYPSIGYLAWKTGYNKRTLQRGMRSLEAQGLLVCVAEAGRRRAREYRIDLRHAKAKPPYRSEGPRSEEREDEADRAEGRQHAAPDQGGAASSTARGGRGDALEAAPAPPETSVGNVQEGSSSAREPAFEEEDLGDFPNHLRPSLEAAWPVIERIAEAKGSQAPPSRAAVARAIASFPDRDHVDAATDLEQWQVFGTAKNAPIQDLVQSFRRTLARSRPKAPQSVEPSESPPEPGRYDRVLQR